MRLTYRINYFFLFFLLLLPLSIYAKQKNKQTGGVLQLALTEMPKGIRSETKVLNQVESTLKRLGIPFENVFLLSQEETETFFEKINFTIVIEDDFEWNVEDLPAKIAAELFLIANPEPKKNKKNDFKVVIAASIEEPVLKLNASFLKFHKKKRLQFSRADIKKKGYVVQNIRSQPRVLSFSELCSLPFRGRLD